MDTLGFSDTVSRAAQFARNITVDPPMRAIPLLTSWGESEQLCVQDLLVLSTQRHSGTARRRAIWMD